MKRDNRLSVKQAADFIGVHTNTIYDWIKEGKLRADKEGKSYKINHMDALDIYTSKTRVDEDKEAIVSTQIVKKEAKIVLHTKGSRLLSNMERWINKAIECNEEYSKKMYELSINEADIIKQSSAYLELFEKLEDDKLEILLKARKEIEDFYAMYDFIEKLNQMSRYKEEKRKTLDEEIDLTKVLSTGDIKFIFSEVTLEDKHFTK